MPLLHESRSLVTGINHITLAVTNIETSFRFYRDVMCFKPLCKWDAGAYFLAGNVWFCLSKDDKRLPSPCYTHIAFAVHDTDFDSMVERLRVSGAPLFKENRSPGRSLYFLDPDSHKLEIHVGSWQERVSIRKGDHVWTGVEWYI